MPVKLKGKVYKTVVRPPLFYGALIWATTRGQEARLEVNEMRMLRWMCGVTRTDQIQNEHERRMLDVDIPVKRRRGRPNLGWKDVCKRDMTQTGLKEDKATNRAEWRKKLISYTATRDDRTSQG